LGWWSKETGLKAGIISPQVIELFIDVPELHVAVDSFFM
jgi:hypothetical protein